MTTPGDAPPPSIIDRAEALTKLATTLEEHMHRQTDVTGFVSRKDALARLESEIGALSTSVRLLREREASAAVDPEVKTRLKKATSEAAPILDVVVRIQAEVAARSATLLKPRALDGLEQQKLQRLQTEIVGAWQSFIGPSEAIGPEQILGSYPAFRSVHEALSAIRKKLAKHSENLPLSSTDLEDVARLRQERASQLDSLKDKGLDQEVVAFLTRSLEGIRLGDLIKRPRVLSWLEQEGIADAFIVKAISPGAKR